MDLNIRCLDTNDLKDIAKLANDRDIAEMTANLPYPYTQTDAATWFDYVQRTESEHVFSICLGNKLIGICELVHEPEHKRAELGYWLGKQYWHNGYATSAAQMLVGYGFSVLGVRKIYANCFGVNSASQHVLEKNGFKLEGCLKDHFIRLGKTHDILKYGLFKDNYDPQH